MLSQSMKERKPETIAIKDFDIRPTDRVMSVGRTGSGKTTLNRELLQQWDYTFTVDPKGEFTLPGAVYIDSPYKLTKKITNERAIIYQPNPDFDDPETYDAVFRWVYNRQNCTLYVDEVYAVMRGITVPRWYNFCLNRGRSRGIRTVSASQRPKLIPKFVVTESEHMFIFDLQTLDDRKTMAEAVGPVAAKKVLQPLPDKPEHVFWYWTVRNRNEVFQYLLQQPDR